MSDYEPEQSSSTEQSSNQKGSISDVIKKLSVLEIDINKYKYDKAYQENIQEIGRHLRDVIEKKISEDESRSRELIIGEEDPLFKEKFLQLEELVKQWKDFREPIKKMLKEYKGNLDRNCKLSSSVRLATSSMEVAGSVGGLLTESGSEWAKYAFTTASVCGLIGSLATFLDVGYSKKMLDEICEGRKKDCKLLEKVVQWFKKNSELDTLAEELFPHGIDTEIILKIHEYSKERDEYLKIFMATLFSNASKNKELLKDTDFLYSLSLFSNSYAARLWFYRLLFREHSFDLDFNRMALQMEYGQTLIYQSIQALPLEQQRLTSFPVAGRIILNILTMYDTISALKAGAKSKFSKNLEELLVTMDKEEKIVNDVLCKTKPRQN